LASKITLKTKAIVVVHLYGYVADMSEIVKLSKKHGILLVEDAAQSMGASLDGKMSGTFGDISVFSLHSHKNITTLGEGGILVIKDPAMAEIVPMLRHNGHCPFPFEQDYYWKPAMSNVSFPELNGQILWPNNYCIGEVECALGEKLLKRIDTMNAEKRARALNFIDALINCDTLEFHREDSKRHNYHLLVAQVTNGKRDDIMKFLAYEKGIQCVVQYYPLNRYPFYQKLGFGKADCPNTDLFFDNMISFPFHHWMSDTDFEYLLESTKEAIDKY
jgi:dTDP-4-amino-4,6-dideoxygalactose transaminase